MNKAGSDLAIEVKSVETAADREAVVEIRRRVFVEEQKVPEELELAEAETEPHYFLARLDAEPVGTGRFRVAGDFVKFERIATLPQARGQGIGRALMDFMQREAARRFPAYLRTMHAQLSAAPFYDALDWQRVGDVFCEAGIEHQTMILPPSSPEELAALQCLGRSDLDPRIRSALDARRDELEA